MSEPLSLFQVEPGYCIDTNVIVSFMYEDDDEPYGRDAFPEQWQTIERLIASGQIADMRFWLGRHAHMFCDLTSEQLALAKAIVNHYPDYGRNENYIGDLEVISLSGVKKLAVITNERVRPNQSVSMPRIPEVCKELHIDCVSVPGFLRRELRAAIGSEPAPAK